MRLKNAEKRRLEEKIGGKKQRRQNRKRALLEFERLYYDTPQHALLDPN
jgi:hypothetical protein